jgi:uncharacterized membrane protein YfbV (UPF0208 family)
MEFFAAMQCMKEGQKVRMKTWPKEKFIGITEEEKKIFGEKRVKYEVITESEESLSPCVSFSVLVASQWEIFKDLSPS